MAKKKSKANSAPAIPNPYQVDSPWPCMRGNVRSTGRPTWSTADWKADPKTPLEIRHFRTGNGVFSTPVIGADETIYVGSADKIFYAFDPMTGKEKWRFKTGEIIDSAACIGPDGTIYVPSGDACIYGLNPKGKMTWKFDVFNERELFTPSTSYWWEGNVVMGPNGLLYAGGDDFYMYAIEPGGKMRWGTLTGLHIWSAATFGRDGEVYASSYDMYTYCFDAETGAVRWKTNTGNFVASTIAIADDDTIYLGSFDGRVYALDGKNGRIKWVLPTGGHVYASPAIAPDGTIYIGSGDGLFYAIDPQWKKVKWTFYCGDPIRSSAALGPDPTGKDDYLIYFGGGEGSIHALDPSGNRRWSYNSLVGALDDQYPNINASIALGRTGLATASANGDIIWIPYHYPFEVKKAKGITTATGDGHPKDGSFWYYVSVGGTPAEKPLAASLPKARSIKLDDGQTISLRLLVRKNSATEVARIEPDSVILKIEPPLKKRVRVSPDGTQINIIPEELPTPGAEYSITAQAYYTTLAGRGGKVTGALKAKAAAAGRSLSLEKAAATPFRISHISVYSPPIVPSFDQIGLASLTIEFAMVEIDPEGGRFSAWGVQKFGIAEEGESVGIPAPRSLFYPINGIYEKGRMIAEAENLLFEITAFPVPLDKFRLTGKFTSKGLQPGSLLAELKIEKGKGFSRFRKSGETPRAVELIGLGSRAIKSAGRTAAKGLKLAETWFPEKAKAADLFNVIDAAAKTLPLGYRLYTGAYKPWGLLSPGGEFVGVGAYRSSDAPEELYEKPEGLRLVDLRYEESMRRVVAEFDCKPGFSLGNRVIGIGLIDVDKCRFEPINYNFALKTTWLDEGRPERTTLEIPLSTKISGKQLRAVVLVDLYRIAELAIG